MRPLWAVLALLLAWPGSAWAEDIVAAQYGNSTGAFPYAIALEKGFFKEAGANVTGVLASVGGGGDVRNLVAGGLAYAEVALPSAVAAIQQGADLVIVSENVQNAASLVWVAKPDSPVNSVHDLKGRRLGYTSPQSFTQAVDFYVLDHAGYKKGDVTMVSTGGFGPGLTALDNGGIDVAVITLPDFLAREGRYKVVMRGGDLVPPITNTVGIVPRQALRDRADFIRAVLVGRRRAVEFMTTHREESAVIIGRAYRLPPAVIAKVLTALIDDGKVDGVPYWGPGNFYYPGLGTMVAAGRTAGLVSGIVDFRSMVDESLLPPDLRSKP